MSIEAKQFNRIARDDYAHALIFHQAFFESIDHGNSVYAKKACDNSKEREIAQKLARKLEQFTSRGHLVNYDLEIFNPQDWAILHYGIGRRAKRHDILAAHQDHTKIRPQIEEIQKSVSGIMAKMPPHHIYMDKLLSYLKRKQGEHV
jgi:tryptophan halogenase